MRDEEHRKEGEDSGLREGEEQGMRRTRRSRGQFTALVSVLRKDKAGAAGVTTGRRRTVRGRGRWRTGKVYIISP